MLKAAIFDMDGLLLDSEPLWRQTEVRIFNDLGAPLTEEMCIQTMGLRIDEVVEHWVREFKLEGQNKQKLQEQIVDGVEELIHKKAEPYAGVQEVFQLFRQRNYKIAVASSSPNKLIAAVLEKFKIRDLLDVVHSSEDEEYGKPHPAIYITTAKKLGVLPVECVALEDSVNGLLAAKAARMKAVAIPDDLNRDDKRYVIADLIIDRLEEFSGEDIDELE